MKTRAQSLPKLGTIADPASAACHQTVPPTVRIGTPCAPGSGADD
jgi:hypothetical protein